MLLKDSISIGLQKFAFFNRNYKEKDNFLHRFVKIYKRFNRFKGQ